MIFNLLIQMLLAATLTESFLAQKTNEVNKHIKSNPPYRKIDDNWYIYLKFLTHEKHISAHINAAKRLYIHHWAFTGLSQCVNAEKSSINFKLIFLTGTIFYMPNWLF